VQLLPIQDFDNDETSTNYNWGYVTMDYNSPEGWYATNIDNESRVRELKQLVAALHQRGIGVIMDVVYNHTANNAPFNSLVPRYYFRFLPDGSYSNGSGCGNDFRSEAPMGRKYIIDTLKHWVQEYGIGRVPVRSDGVDRSRYNEGRRARVARDPAGYRPLR